MIRAILIPTALLAMSERPAPAMPRSFTVKSVVVQHDGQWHADRYGQQTPAECRRFKLSATDARRWFAKATEVSQSEWLERLDWTQCSADGTLVTDSGRTYRWELDQSGRGEVIVSPTVSVYLSGSELSFAVR